MKRNLKKKTLSEEEEIIEVEEEEAIIDKEQVCLLNNHFICILEYITRVQIYTTRNMKYKSTEIARSMKSLEFISIKK
jgi:Mor family transcriptional regulator